MNAAFALGSDSSSPCMGLAFSGIFVVYRHVRLTSGGRFHRPTRAEVLP